MTVETDTGLAQPVVLKQWLFIRQEIYLYHNSHESCHLELCKVQFDTPGSFSPSIFFYT